MIHFVNFYKKMNQKREIELMERIKVLEKENKMMKDQLRKVKSVSDYLKEETIEYMKVVDKKEKNFRFKIFKRYLEKLHEPKNHFDELLMNFYQYIIQHIELHKLTTASHI